MSAVPPALSGKEFEALILESVARCQRYGTLCGGRYGVMVTMVDGKWLPIPSYPDFEGCLSGGRQWIVEAKTCSQSSFPMVKQSLKPKQVKHMLERSAFGALSFLFIHFNERRSTRINDPGITYAIPVTSAWPRWKQFVDAYSESRKSKEPVEPQGSISRDLAHELGTVVRWICPKGSRKPLPDILNVFDPHCSILARQPELI